MDLTTGYSLFQVSERCILIEFGSIISESINAEVHALKRAIDQSGFPFVQETVPAYSSLAVYFDIHQLASEEPPGENTLEKLRHFLSGLTQETSLTKGNQEVKTVPVCYDPKLAIDLRSVADSLVMSTGEVIEIHSSALYTVFMIGFVPGFPYLGVLPERLRIDRKKTPLKKVTAGSVGIADRQTGIYPFEVPGGWNIVGRTPLKLFSGSDSNPTLLNPDDKVKFTPISLEEFNTMNEYDR